MHELPTNYFFSQPEEKNLPYLIQQRRVELKALKEEWRSIIQSRLIDKYPAFYNQLESILKKGELIQVSEGLGGTYFLLNEKKEICFVIKPMDEDILCLNNYKDFATPFNNKEMRVRAEIPLYRSCQNSAAAASLARLINLPEVTPNTYIAIIKSHHFYDLSNIELQEKEKLCSVQEYLPHSQELYDQLQEWIKEGLSDSAIGELIDQQDFEEANLFIWLCFDNDAHVGNFRSFKKSTGLFGLKKIDNNLTFPEKNRDLLNCLSLFPNAEKSLSESSRELINNIPFTQIANELIFYDLESSLPALKERLSLLQELIKKREITIREINNEMMNLK